MINSRNRILLIWLSIAGIGTVVAQTNTFPSTGYVGVGTTSPQRTLTVAGSGQATLMVADSNFGTTASDGFQLQQISGNSHLINEENGFLSLWTNATERMRIDAAGNIGIGLTNPQRAFEIGLSDVAGVGFEKFTNSPVAGVLRFGDNTGWKFSIGRSRNSSGGSLNTGTNGVIATFQDNGNVGIGTTSPDSRFQVDVDTNKEIRMAVGASNALSDISVGGPGIVFSRAHDGSDNIAAIFQYSDSAGNSRLALAARDDLVFAAGGASIYTYAPERMRITSAGNVGIGTNAPISKLDISQVNPSGWSGNLKAARIVSPDTSYTLSINTYIVAGGNVGYHFSPNNNTGLVLTTPGNVGIGTTTPSHKLAVNGTIRAKEVIVDTGWADYVFEENYRLAPLAEVEQHIRDKKHLPGIPSAAEAAEKGVSLGEMQTLLLAKVEELTLHLIALQKENEALKSRLSRVETALSP